MSGLNNSHQGALYLRVKVLDNVKVEELVLILVAEQGVQSSGQCGCRVGLVKVFGWKERSERRTVR